MKEFFKNLNKKEIAILSMTVLFMGAIGCALSAGGDITIAPPAVKGSINFDGGSLGIEAGQQGDTLKKK